MRINRHPALACSVFLEGAANGRGEILLEPLGKLPVVRDTKVNRSMISERLKELHVWLPEKRTYEFGQSPDLQFQAAMDMLCGICLEACPAFGCDPEFAGAASMVGAEKRSTRTGTMSICRSCAGKYRKHFFDHFRQSLACVKACPCICLCRNCRPPQTARPSGRKMNL